MTRYESKKKFMEVIYESNYIKWKDKYLDDRLIYCNIYETIMGAIESIKNINNSLVWCGFSKVFNEEIKMLDDIKERFE